MGDTFPRHCGRSPRSVLMRGYDAGFTSTERNEAAAREGRAHAAAWREAGASGASARCVAPIGDALGAGAGRRGTRSALASRSAWWALPPVRATAERTRRIAQARSHLGRIRDGDVDAATCGGADRRALWGASVDLFGVE